MTIKYIQGKEYIKANATVKPRLHLNGYNWIQVVSSCIHLYPPSRTCIYLYPFVSDTKCICIHLYLRVEHCFTLDTCIHLYPLVSTCIARCKRKLDTSGYMSPIHPAKITITIGVATSEWAQKCNMGPMLWSLLQPIPNPARPRPSSFSSRNQRYHDWWYSTN